MGGAAGSSDYGRFIRLVPPAGAQGIDGGVVKNGALEPRHLKEAWSDNTARQAVLPTVVPNHRYLFDNIPFGLGLFTLSGQLLDANPTLVQIFGRSTLSELIDNWRADEDIEDPVRFWDWLRRNDERTEIEIIQPTDDNGRGHASEGKTEDIAFGFKARFRRQPSGSIWARLCCRKLDTTLRREPLFELSFEDITESEVARETLEAQRQKLEGMISHFPGMAYRWLNDGERMSDYISPGAFDLIGYDSADLVGKNNAFYLSLIYPDDLARVKNAIGGALAERKPYSIEYRIIARDGALKWVWDRGGSHDGQLGEDGRPTSYEGFVSDITDRKKVEESQREAEERYQSLMTSVADIVHIKDASGRYVSVNDEIGRVLGRASEDFIGKTALDIYPSSIAQKIYDDDMKVLREGRIVDTEDYHLAEMKYLVFHVRKVPIKDKNGTVTGMVTIGRDITQRKRDEEDLQQAKERYRALFEGVSESVHIKDAQARYVIVNSALAKKVRMVPEDVIGKTALDIYPPGIAEKIYSDDLRCLQTGEKVDTIDQFESPGREVQYSHVRKVPLRDSTGKVSGLVSVSRDVTDQILAEAKLCDSEKLFRAVVEQSSDGIAMWTPGGDVVLYNHAMEQISGYKIEEVKEKGWFNLAYRTQAERKSVVRLGLRAIRGIIDRAEVPIMRKDGQTAWISLRMTNLNIGEKQYTLCICTDVTERRSQEARLTYLATHDQLTDLPNRLSLATAMKQAIEVSRSTTTSALLYIDLDNFKIINDTAGHAAGDQTLVTLTAILRDKLRADDFLARTGGDEFAVLLANTSVEIAWEVADRLRKAVDGLRISIGGHHFNLGLSIGLVEIDGSADSAMLLARGDAAMYYAKERGKNRIVIYRPEDYDISGASDSNRLVLRLKDALRENLFVLHYQPIVRLSDDTVEHYEALIRLRGTRGELIPPNSFIPVAERFGLMPQITRWVLRDVFKTLTKNPDIRLFVNLSAHCLADEDLLQYIARNILKLGIAPGRLGFEITETTMVRDLGLAERWVGRLKELGCRFALDDFGSGFSSFVSLRNLPVDHLKIDGSLVRSIAKDPTQRAIIHSMQTLAEAMGKEVIAEYVENAEIASVLRELGVAFGQGFYLGRPSPGFERDR